MRSLVAFFAERSLLVNLLLVLFVLAGIQALNVMQFNTYPEIDFGETTVITAYPGASAEDVELQVTTPLEEEILKVNGIEKLISNSVEGVSTILVRFDIDNPAEKNNRLSLDVQKAVDRAMGRLPPDLPQNPQVKKLDFALAPVLRLLVAGNVPEETIRFNARRLSNALREIDGISGINREGYRKREVRILLKPDRLHQLNISFDEIIQSIRRRNLRDSGGSLESFLAEKQIITVGQFQDPKEVEDVIVRSRGQGNYVRIKDIAEVVYDYEDWDIQSTLNDGETGVSLYVLKRDDADGLSLSREIKSFVENYESELSPGVKIVVLDDTARFTESMLDALVGNGLFGILLVFIILLLFFPWRFTLWVTAGIPVAVFMTFALMPLFGFDVTQLTMASIILMLGLLVDDAIVTSESIFLEAERGLPPLDAAVKGTMNVMAPVVASAATTLLAFFPLVFLSGVEGKFIWMIPAMCIIVLICSLFECKFMLPAHIKHSLHRSGEIKNRAWFLSIAKAYSRAIRWCLNYRYVVVIAFVACCVLISALSLRSLNVVLYPDVDIDTLYVKVELPPGYSFETTREKVSELREMVKEEVLPADLQYITTTVGHHSDDAFNVMEGRQPFWAILSINLQPRNVRSTNSLVILDRLRARAKDFHDYKQIIVIPQREAPLTGKPVEVNIIGNDESRYSAGEIIQDFLRDHSGTTEVWSSYSPGKDVINLRLNYERLADFGLQVADVTQAVRVAFDGLIVDELQTLDERIDYRLQLRPEDQGKIDTLYALTLINDKGLSVPLRSLVGFEVKPGESSIQHLFGDRALTIYAEIDRDKTSVAKINQELKEILKTDRLHQQFPKLRFTLTGEITQQEEMLGNVLGAGVLCLAGILFVLVIVFNSISQPLLIFSVIPLGLTGVFLCFALQGIDMSITATIGILGLSGVLVNDALVMINRLNMARQTNDGRVYLSLSGIVEGTQERLRPIFITTVTTVAGLFPAAYGLAGGNPFITPMIMTMLWGVAFGSLITLFFLPCLYAVEQDISRFIKQRLQKIVHQ